MLRSLLVVGWFLWAALTLSVISALVGSQPRLGHVRIPRLAMFDGVAVWIAAGLTVLSSVSPLPLCGVRRHDPFNVRTSRPRHALGRTRVEAGLTGLPRIGYERVETGESIEMFAERTLGDSSRWTEIWEIGQDSVVDCATGTKWTEPWRLEGGWELRLPTPTRAAGFERPEQTFDAGLRLSRLPSGPPLSPQATRTGHCEDLLLSLTSIVLRRRVRQRR